MGVSSQPIIYAGSTFPARGTWIEISASSADDVTLSDVPRKGNVDRNAAVSICLNPSD